MLAQIAVEIREIVEAELSVIARSGVKIVVHDLVLLLHRAGNMNYFRLALMMMMFNNVSVVMMYRNRYWHWLWHCDNLHLSG